MNPPLTFGVELEFNVLEVPNGKKDPNPEDPRAAPKYEDTDEERGRDVLQREIAKALTEAGLPATTKFCPNLSSWFVTSDSSVFAPHREELSLAYHFFNFQDIELNSPILYFGDRALDSVRLSCEVLTKEFRTANFRTSGLHVHVGNGGQAFTLETLRKLGAFLWIFEDQIHELHYRKNNGYAGSLRNFSVLATQISKELPIAPQSGRATLMALQKIYDCKTVEMFLKLFSIQERDAIATGPVYLAYRFHNLSEKDYRLDYQWENFKTCEWEDEPKKTIEFRQGAGTLNPDWICMWVRTIHGIMSLALSEDNDEAVLNLLVGVAKREMDGKELPDIYDIFTALGMEDCKSYFCKTRELRSAIRNQGVMDDHYSSDGLCSDSDSSSGGSSEPHPLIPSEANIGDFQKDVSTSEEEFHL